MKEPPRKIAESTIHNSEIGAQQQTPHKAEARFDDKIGASAALLPMGQNFNVYLGIDCAFIAYAGELVRVILAYRMAHDHLWSKSTGIIFADNQRAIRTAHTGSQVNSYSSVVKIISVLDDLRAQGKMPTFIGC